MLDINKFKILYYFYLSQAEFFKYKTNSLISASSSMMNCNARYGGIDGVISGLQAYANSHITRSFEYLLMSTHYGNYEKNREGFEKLFRSLSDEKWNDAIELIKYMAKRGGQMNFSQRLADTVNGDSPNYELYEMDSIAKALDMEKQLAVEAHNIHSIATRKNKDHHEPETSSYLENEYMHRQANTIRKLSGYVTDLYSLINSPDNSLALYMFDEYLKKQ